MDREYFRSARFFVLLGLLILIIVTLARAQTPTQIQVTPTPPTGACNPPTYIAVTPAGQFYTCLGGTTTVGAQFPPILQTSTGAPTNACSANMLDVDTTTGNLYTCLNGAWNLLQTGTPVLGAQVNGAIYWNGTGLTSTAPGGVGTLCLTETNGGIPTWGACSGSSSTAFANVTAGTNATALVIGTGGSLATSGTGTIAATTVSEALQSLTVASSTALNLSGANFTLPKASGFVSTAVNMLGADTATGLVHIWTNGADGLNGYWLAGGPAPLANAVVTSGGGPLLQTPNSTTTLDAAGNFSTPGTVSAGVGSGVVGSVHLPDTAGHDIVISPNPTAFTGTLLINGASGDAVLTEAGTTGLLVGKNAAMAATPVISGATAGTYMVCVITRTNVAGTGAVTAQVGWTDSVGTKVRTLNGMNLTTNNFNADSCFAVRLAPGAGVNVQTIYTGDGTDTYDLQASVAAIGK